MQLTIDADRDFIEALKEEFNTANIKEALYELLDFYRNSSKIETISSDEKDYLLIMDAKQRRKAGERTYSIDSVIGEYQ